MTVTVLGRFPPPLDGQAIATERLASLLDRDEAGRPAHAVQRVDVGAPEGETLTVTAGAGAAARARHFWRRRATLPAALVAADGAPVLWASISPSALGHARDLAVVARALPRRRTLAVVHRGDFHELFASPLTRRTGRRLVRSLGGVVFLTEGLAARCADEIPDARRHVVPNTIDDASIPSPAEVEAARAARGARGGLRLLYLSGMIPSKGYPDVLEALAVLRARGLDASAQFAGRWPSAEAEAAFRGRIASLGLEGTAKVLGGVSDRAAVRRLYLGADVFVLPTQYPVEAQPLTIIEALAAGTPVVATRHAGIPEMLSEREGAFAPAGAPERLADAIAGVAAPEAWRSRSVAARARFETAFSPSAVRARWDALLGGVAGH